MLQWFSFRGRANRLSYVLGTFAPIVLTLLAIILLTILGAVLTRFTTIRFPGRFPGFLSMTLAVMALVIMLWTSLAATVRRMRDLGWPIWLGVGIMVVLGVGGSFKADALIRHYQGTGALVWAGFYVATLLFWLVLFLWPGRPKDTESVANVFGPIDADTGSPAQFG